MSSVGNNANPRLDDGSDAQLLDRWVKRDKVIIDRQRHEDLK